MSLPSLMVAPNGATKTKTDHPALPITLDEVTETARVCVAAGADGLHLHLRDIEGGHLLDSGAYREALEHLARELPALPVQITTEAGGRYDPGHQKYVALHSGARLVSAAWREITREEGAPSFYAYAAERGIAVQHILYDVADAEGLAAPGIGAPGGYVVDLREFAIAVVFADINDRQRPHRGHVHGFDILRRVLIEFPKTGHEYLEAGMSLGHQIAHLQARVQR